MKDWYSKKFFPNKVAIGILGVGYVGMITAVGFAKKGFDVTLYDIDKIKTSHIQEGRVPFFEADLQQEFSIQYAEKKFTVCRSLDELVAKSNIIFICVGTPSNVDGSINLNYVMAATRSVANQMKVMEDYKVLIVRSTVIPGTTVNRILPIFNELNTGSSNVGLAVMPEFLREGMGLSDFENPDRIIIGISNKKLGRLLREFFSVFNCPLFVTDETTAEMVKYASNSFLATKISFINEISNLCESIDANIDDVVAGMALDSRISLGSMKPGIGYGGSCFSKDISAIHSLFKLNNQYSTVLDAVQKVNQNQALRVVQMLEKKMPLPEKDILILGLTFKRGTDDVRNSQATVIVKELLRKGAIVRAWDPYGLKNAKAVLPTEVTYKDNLEESIAGVDAIIIATDWCEFACIPENFFKKMRNKLIIDGKRLLRKFHYANVETIRIGDVQI